MTIRRPRAGPGSSVACVLLLAALGAGCGLIFEEDPDRPAPARPLATPEPAADTAGIPGGLGTLRLDQISVYLRRGELQMRITPLTESVSRTALPEVWQHLTGLRSSHQVIFREQTGSAVDFQLVLVAVHAESVPAGFEPEEVTLVSRGLRYRPVNIRPVSSAWTRRVVFPRETLLAVYAFPPEVTLDPSLEIEYQEVRMRNWGETLTRVEAERERIRARLP